MCFLGSAEFGGMSDDGSLKKSLLGVNRLKRLFQTKNNEEEGGWRA